MLAGACKLVSVLTTTILLQATTEECQWNTDDDEALQSSSTMYVHLCHYSLGLPPDYLIQIQHERPHQVPRWKCTTFGLTAPHNEQSIARHQEGNCLNQIH